MSSLLLFFFMYQLTIGLEKERGLNKKGRRGSKSDKVLLDLVINFVNKKKNTCY